MILKVEKLNEAMVSVEIENKIALQRQLDVLKSYFEIESTLELIPFYKDHYFIIARLIDKNE